MLKLSSDINVHIYKGLAEFVGPYSIESISKALANRNKNIISTAKRKEFMQKISLDKYIDNLYKLIFD